ncbi:MAG: hypothetical protein JXA89_03975 [Anaerolineae bacterium]|nr:hypothetical protein [Anaerolineae bacterium]
MSDNTVRWLLESGEPWTCYRTLLDLLDRPQDDSRVQAARARMLAHPQVQALIAEAAEWPGYTLQRHNDARHPIYKLSTLADFGLQVADPVMGEAVEKVIAHQSAEGAFQSSINIPKAFGGTNEDMWTWIVCDAPTLLYALLAFGLVDDPRVQRAADHLVDLVNENGWRCTAAPELGKFKGPGKRSDPCPIANVYALKALSLVPRLPDSEAAHLGTEMLLSHWQARGQTKYFLFGIGTDFKKLKYPFVWYNILHVAEVLSLFPFVHGDPRFQEMLEVLIGQVDENGRYTAASMYQAWKGWSFADKKQPSPWLTFLVLRIQKRVQDR